MFILVVFLVCVFIKKEIYEYLLVWGEVLGGVNLGVREMKKGEDIVVVERKG